MTPEIAQTMLKENFAEWVQNLNLTVLESTPYHVLVRMPVQKHIQRMGEIVCGQSLAALADTTMVLSVVANSGEFKPYATTDLHTQFLRPGIGTAILCRAQVVRAGRSLVFARAEMTVEDNGKIISTATATFFAP